MRKITTEAIKAFYNGKKYAKSNTSVVINEKGNSKMYLHGNLIAINNGDMLEISSAGWETKTTKERLNGLLLSKKMIVKQKNFEWFLYNTTTGEKMPFIKGSSMNDLTIF